MANSPEYQPRVGLSGQPQPALNVQPVPGAYGLALAHAGMDAADRLGQIASTQRQMDAQFAASDAELSYGEERDQLMQKFAQLKGLDPSAQIQAYKAQLGQVREKYEAQLADPLAARNYRVRTRLQTQTAERRMDQHVIDSTQAWKKDTVLGKRSLAIRDIQPSFDKDGDMRTLQSAANSYLPDLQALMVENGVPPEKIKAGMEEEMGVLAEAMLDGYTKRPELGSKILNAVFPGTQNSIREVLGPARVKKWEEHFDKTYKAEKQVEIGANIWNDALAAGTDPVSKRFNEAEARKVFEAQPSDIQALTKADFEHRVAVQNHLQHTTDVKNEAALMRIAHTNGTIDYKSPEWVALGEEGRLKVEDARKVYRADVRARLAEARAEERYKRSEENAAAAEQRRADAQAKAEAKEALLNAKDRYRQIPIEQRANLSDDDVMSLFADQVGPDGIDKIKAMRQEDRRRVEKGTAIKHNDFVSRANTASKEMSGSQKAKFMEQVEAEFGIEEKAHADGLVPGDKVKEIIGRNLLYLDTGIVTSTPYYRADSEQKAAFASGKLKPNPTQKYPEAVEYLKSRKANVVKVDAQGNVIGAK